jgi:hypothetical protein
VLAPAAVSFLQSGGRFDQKLVFSGATSPIDLMDYLWQPLKNFWDSKQFTSVIRVSESYEELVKNNQRIALVEVALATSEKSLALLWHKWDSKEKSESAEKSKILFEVLKLVGAVIIGGVLAHFGLRLDL